MSGLASGSGSRGNLETGHDSSGLYEISYLNQPAAAKTASVG